MNRLFISKRESFPANSETVLPDVVDYLEKNLAPFIKNHKSLMRTVLLAEETSALLLEKADEGSSLQVKINKLLGDLEVIISSKGSEVDPIELKDLNGTNTESYEDEGMEEAIRAILLKAMGERLQFSYKAGSNQVRILAERSESSMLKSTLISLVLGILFGALMVWALPEAFSDFVCKYALEPIKTVFMNALKMVIAPVVFFSIVSCVSQFKNVAELGRIGAKVIGMYLLTTVIAVFLALIVNTFLRPGEWGFALSLDAVSVSVNTDVDTSLLNTIINIVPANFFKPFLESDTLSLIFLAFVCGIAVGKIGDYSKRLADFFEACNSLFLTITTMIAGFIPLAVFCSGALMLKRLGGKSFFMVLGMAGTQVFAICCMLVVYGLLVLVLARLNPITFFKKNAEGMVNSFSLCSSSGAIPTNIKICSEKMGISPKVCNFSIPLGATINMDGTCLFLVTCGMFLARAYAIEIPTSSMASLMVTISLLSLGAPGVPGSGIVCLGIVLESIGVPVEGIALVMGIYPFLDMFDTMSNTTGDVATSLIVAKNEGLVDTLKFKA